MRPSSSRLRRQSDGSPAPTGIFQRRPEPGGSSLRSSVALSSSPLRPKRNPGLAGVMDGDRTQLPYVRLMKGEWAMPLRVIFTTLFVIALATFGGPVASADSGTDSFAYLAGSSFLCGLPPSAA